MRLIPRTREEVRATIAALSPEVRTQVSSEWLVLLESSSEQDPWIHGFCCVNDDGVHVGLGSFKGPPVDGIVEIAYAVAPKYQGKGYATAAARALAAHAFESGEVRTVRGHTLPDGAASQRVLIKSGFRKVGEVVVPDDGLVWRFELRRPTSGLAALSSN
jgi:RimJ/RimL family protein N-acetyltransferase